MPDQRLIDQRRIAAGLTIWQLADRLGLNVEVVRSLTEIEEFSRDSEQLDHLGFGTVRHLCTLLDIDLNQLLPSTDHERPPTAAADDVKVEAALADHGTAVTQEDLAATLGWPPSNGSTTPPGSNMSSMDSIMRVSSSSNNTGLSQPTGRGCSQATT